MTTFTLQDLNQNTMGEVLPKPLTKEEFMAYGMANPPNAEQILKNLAIPQAPEPQPSLEQIITTICTQLQLLTTVINQGNSPNTTPPEGNQSLQETVSLTLQQAEWFKELVEQEVDKRDFDELVSEITHDRVCSEVEEYFNYSFDPTDHFDMNDAVAEEVDNRLDDVVRDRLDDVVKEQLEELVAEKLKGIRIVFD